MIVYEYKHVLHVYIHEYVWEYTGRQASHMLVLHCLSVNYMLNVLDGSFAHNVMLYMHDLIESLLPPCFVLW